EAPDPASATPAEVRRFVRRLGAKRLGQLERRAPGVVGNLDGVPDRVRYAANELAWRQESPHGAHPAGRLLGYDPRGDGRLVEVFGDLDRARHVAVIVPGSGWTLRNLTGAARRHGADPIAAAQALRDQGRRVDPRTSLAVVVWLGYDPPERIDQQAARSGRAVAGARALRRFLDGLPRGAHLSLLCHSYGAVVCGHTAPGAPVGDLVALAAPGMDVPSARALHTRARVWAARVPDDPMRFVPFVRVADLGHDADPTRPAFGARVLRTGAASGHDGYFTPGTELLANLAHIVLHRTTEVTLVHAA
ncbi:MAG TPA: alpha/beta hydrolase, partial [Actinomycetes bacterium]